MHEVTELERLNAERVGQIHPVILSGGAGTRLWPLSRAALPKQFFSLMSDQTLFQQTIRRNSDDAGFDRPVIVCNEEHRFVIDDQLRQAGIRDASILVEPSPRNTAPAIAVAALWLLQSDPAAVMLVQPCDHVIGSVVNLHQAVTRSLAAVRQGRLVTFGVKPMRAETGYGYIAPGAKIENGGGACAIDRFIEKPGRDEARRLVESGAFYWNSGIFLFAAQHYLEELERLHPGMLEACHKALAGAKSDLGFLRLDAEAFGKAPSLSIDNAVMEHTDRAAVVLTDMDWKDVGSWRALWEAGSPDQDGNVVRGAVYLDSMRDSYVHAGDHLVAAVGLENVVVVATDDAVLVASTDRASDVSEIVKRLQQQNRLEAVQHTTCYRPWGHYKTVDSGGRFQVKRITVKPGGQLSLQRHFHRAEHWVVVEGTARVRRGAETLLVTENQSVYIPIGTEHRLENPGKVPLHLIEVQSGAYLGEDDIVRIEDGYGRA